MSDTSTARITLARQTVWRFDVAIEDEVKIEAPLGTMFLGTVQESDRVEDGLTLWGIVRPHAPTTTRHLRIAGTGHDLAPDGERPLRYIGSANVLKYLWFHIFEVDSPTGVPLQDPEAEVLYVAQPGDAIPDPDPLGKVDPVCQADLPTHGYACTLPSGHHGVHMAGSGERVVAIWRSLS